MSDETSTAPAPATEAAPETFKFQAEINMLMSLIVNTIYSNNEIFLRELISNASDALDKIRFEGLTHPEALESAPELKIEIIPDAKNNALIIQDTGIGMSKSDLIKNLGTIAHSGTRAFMQAIKSGADISMIGQFGVGFYSAFLVADKVTVISKNNEDEQYVWESQAGGEFTLKRTGDEHAQLGRGTTIILHLKSDMEEFLKEDRLRNLVKKHSAYIAYPINLQVLKTEEREVDEPAAAPETAEGEVAEESEDAPKKTETVETIDWERVNNQDPLWMRPSSEVTQAQYDEFYKSLGNDWEGALAHTHFRVEGGLEFRSILFTPPRAPFDLFNSQKKRNNIKLYVRRVFIMDDCEDLCPEYLGFIRGIVDSEDLPLNLSRETLQHNRILSLIKRNIVKKAIKMFKDLSEDEEKYSKFYKAFGKNLKLGVHEDSANRKKLLDLIRYNSSKSGDDMISLQDYIDRMAEGQSKIYFLTGESQMALKHSPFLEKLRKRDIEVLLMAEPIDEYMMQQVKEYKDHEFVNIAKEGVDLGDSEDEKANFAKLQEEYKALTEHVKTILGDKVEKCSISNRVVSSPAVLVSTEHGLTANLERLMKNQALGNNDMMLGMGAKKVMELNCEHPIIKTIKVKYDADPASRMIKDLVWLIYETALLSSGYSLETPANFASRIHRMIALSIGADDLEEEEAVTVEEAAVDTAVAEGDEDSDIEEVD